MEDIALLVLRAVLGSLFVGHGAQKLFGWFGGPGLEGTAGWLGSLNLKPATFWAVMAAGGELVGGFLLVLGLLTPLAALAIIAAMVMAIVLVHGSNGLWAANGGIEVPLIIITVAVSLALIGPGSVSLDAALDLRLPASIAYIGVFAVLGALVAALVGRRGVPATTEA